MLVMVSLAAASGLGLLALRSMALAFTATVDAHPRPAGQVSNPRRQSSALRSHEIALLLTEIALSIGIALAIVGLAVTAALPVHWMVGALLAQLAVLGSLVAPPVSVRLLSVWIRPAAIALLVAQLANVAFFVKAINALL